VSPATQPRSARAIRILRLDATSGAIELFHASDLPALFAPGDVIVVNDAATLPASFVGTTAKGDIELRLAACVDDRTWVAAAFGEGDYHTRTEDRAAPPPLAAGDRIQLAHGLEAVVVGFRPETKRLVVVRFRMRDREDVPLSVVWAALYRAGRPVQYAHVPAPLALWDVQNVYAGRPWAVEMPSAGRVIRAETLALLAARGVTVVSLTHAAGLSSIGAPELDALLPLPERYEIPEETVRAIAQAKRVIAIGTSVVRALEGNAHDNAGRLTAGAGVTSYLLGPSTQRRIVDAVLTGVHDADTSHFTLLHAFATKANLEQTLATAIHAGLLGHELGDTCLVWGESVAVVRRSGAASALLKSGADEGGEHASIRPRSGPSYRQSAPRP